MPKFATFARFCQRTKGAGQEDLDLVCRDNQKINGKIASETGKPQKVTAWWFEVLERVDETCRDFLIIYIGKAEK